MKRRGSRSISAQHPPNARRCSPRHGNDAPRFGCDLRECRLGSGESRRFPCAEEAYKEALAIAEPLYKRNSDRTLYRDDVARYFLNLGVLYSNNADPKLAADSFTQAAENWTELVRTHPKVKQFRYSAAKSERLLAGSEFRLAMNKEPQDYETKAKRGRSNERAMRSPFFFRMNRTTPIMSPKRRSSTSSTATNCAIDGRIPRPSRHIGVPFRVSRVCLRTRDDPINKRSLANALLQLGVCLQRIEQPSDGRAARFAEASNR